MSFTVEEKIDLLEQKINALEVNQISLINQGAYLLQTVDYSGSNSNSYFEIQYQQSGNQLSVPIQSSIILPKGLRAENYSGSTLILKVENPKLDIDDESLNNLYTLFFDFFLSIGSMIFVSLFVYYVGKFFFNLVNLNK